MISIDTSVCAKWFKSGERFDPESRDLRDRLESQEVEAAANEILSLEIVRGLEGLQARQPALGPTDTESEMEVRNPGQRTLQDVKVEVRSTPPGGSPETRELLLDYLPAQSVQRLYVYFRQPPRALHVEAETPFYRLD